MPRVLKPPPATSPPDDVAAALVEAIRAYAAGTNGQGLTPRQRALGAHHIAVTAERAFNSALAAAHAQPDVSWPMLHREHGMAISSLQRRVDRADPGDGR